MYKLEKGAEMTQLDTLQLDEARSLSQLSVKIFGDSADRAVLLELASHPLIAGFTTNPSLMRKTGIADYREFARDLIAAIPDRPISFEVIADDFADMERQALEIAGWGANVYVKIPVTNTRRDKANELVARLARAGVKQNVTALMTLEQVREISGYLADGPACSISVFAGRIADTGRDPFPIMAAAANWLRSFPNIELVWASPRELLNVFQADAAGCHIITVTDDLFRKFHLVGKDLLDYSLETVKMFFDDARWAGYTL